MASLLDRVLQEGVVALGVFAVLVASLEIGFRFGRRRTIASEESASAGAQIGAIQGALLGLVGLLLAFSFAAAASRFLERQDLIVREANAIGTAHLRADLLGDPHRSDLKRALEEYTVHRLVRIPHLLDLPPEVQATFARFHERIWSAARDGVQAERSATVVVLDAVNEVIDVHTLRVAAARKHLPILVLSILFAASVLALAVIGYGCGLVRDRKSPMTIPLALLIGAALWTIIDLDHARRGLLQLNDAPLAELGYGDVAPP